MCICGYGCENKAVYSPKKGQSKWCCQDHFTKCPGFIKKANKKKKNRSYAEMYGEDESKRRKKLLSYNMKLNNPMFNNEPWNKNKIGVYSDESIQKMKDSGGKHMKDKTYEELYGQEKADELKSKLSLLMSETMTQREPWNKGVQNCFSVQTRQIMSRKAKERVRLESRTKYNLIYYRYKYPFFYKIEKPIEDESGNILVKCKNCNKYFKPTGTQLYERIRQLEKDYGNDGCYFYCSDQCKGECPLFNLKSDPFKDKTINYTDEEYHQFREFVLDRDGYECQYCGKQAEHVHHERPQKLEPFFALDPDFAWSVCKECHYKYGHKEECSTGQLSVIVCN
ncbi:MAG TPA: hypothetical protein VMX17_08590 [Candidatus Glassbacteria bacterium]|nr:hypothetical protein [Candidatus Glassbacteria bacterium]